MSGHRDALGTPAEIKRETAAIPGPVTLVFLDGDHSLRRRDGEVADVVADWLTDTDTHADPGKRNGARR